MKAIVDAVRNRYFNQIGAGSGDPLPTQYDNAEFTKPNPQDPTTPVWAAFSIRLGDAVRADIGSTASRRFRVVGVAYVQLFGPVDKGQENILTIADRVVAAFRDVVASSITYRTPSVSIPGRDGGWWQVTVACPFQADYLA